MSRPAFTLLDAAEVGRAPRTAPTEELPREVDDLVRLAAGVPVTDPACDLIDFVNTAWNGLDPGRDPDRYSLPEVALDYVHRHVGTERRAGGDRAKDVASALQRYVLPFALEWQSTQPDGRGVAALRLQHAKMLETMLSGGALLPAATVAGDLLGRSGLSCTWLTLAEAAAVSDGGMVAVQARIATGELSPTTDGGVHLVRPLWLRDAGLLCEREDPHGLGPGTQRNILTLLTQIVEHARDLGADVRGNFGRLKPIAPLPHQRMRDPKKPPRFVGLAEVAAVARYLSPVYQIALWLMRMCGLRIGEAYGVQVSSLKERAGRLWLHVQEQGGKDTYGRDDDGRLRRVTRRPGTKTGRDRLIPLPEPLAAMIREVIRLFHTDPTTGEVNTAARLIPGIGSDDDGGISGLYSALKAAFAALRAEGADVQSFNPHDLRYSVITALANRGVDKRLRKWYLGHRDPGEPNPDVHDGYDLGPQGDELVPVAAVLTDLSTADGLADLRVPTAKAVQWGVDTRWAATADRLRAGLADTGWQVPLPRVVSHEDLGTVEPGEPALSARELAAEAGVKPQVARRWLANGDLPSHQRQWGTRKVWYAYRRDVDAFLARRASTIQQLADHIGYDYHQTYMLLVRLGRLGPHRRKGEAVTLTDEDIAAVTAEVDRREAAAATAMMLADAAQRLNLPVGTVETLLRQGRLHRAPNPDGTRHRYVTLASVEGYAAAHPAATGPVNGELVVPIAVVKKTLGVTRPVMTHLVTSRQLVARTVRRRQCITLASALRRLEERPVAGAREALAAAAVSL